MSNREETFGFSMVKFIIAAEDGAGARMRFRSHHSDTEVLVQGYQAWGMAPTGAPRRYVRICVYDEIAKRF